MYAAVEDFEERLGKSFAAIYRGDSEPPAADLTAASAEIDGYLAGRYAVPVTAPEAQTLLNDWCLTLAEERAYARTGGSTIPEKVTRRVDVVRKLLRDAASGAFRLPAEAPESEAGFGAALIAECDPPVFGRSNMEGY